MHFTMLPPGTNTKVKIPYSDLGITRKLGADGQPIGKPTAPEQTPYASLRYTCIGIGLFIVGFTFLFCIGTLLFFPYPLRAACDVQWYFGSQCCPAKMMLARQIAAWESNANCSASSLRAEGCRYHLLAVSSAEVKARHYSFDRKSIDDITLSFQEYGKGGCLVTARSATQQTQMWPMMIDMGTNYCNLRNLIEASGLTKMAAFHEETENKKCTQFSDTVCAITHKRKCQMQQPQ